MSASYANSEGDPLCRACSTHAKFHQFTTTGFQPLSITTVLFKTLMYVSVDVSEHPSECTGGPLLPVM